MNESKRHALVRDLVYRLFKDVVGESSAVGCDQFVYFDGEDPKKRLAPDAFVKLGVKDSLFDSWKTWELGSPELCVEILSPSDTGEFLPLKTKMTRYRTLGVQELVLFDVEREPGHRLRAFDRIDGDLVERVVEGERTPCVILTNAYEARFDWFLAPADDIPLALRLEKNGVVRPTPAEYIDALRKHTDALERANEGLAHEIDKLKKKR